MKKTKLTEKPSSILDIAEENISQKFRDYIEEISQLNTNTESARAQRFFILHKALLRDSCCPEENNRDSGSDRQHISGH